MKSPLQFSPRGQSGKMVSEIFPHLGEHVERQRTLVVRPQPGEVERDRAPPDQKEAASQVFTGQQRAFRQRLLTPIGDALAAEPARAELVQQAAGGGAAMQRQRDGSLWAIGDRFAGRLVGGDGHQRYPARLGGGRVGTMEKQGLDFLDGVEDGLGLKRRASQTGDKDLPPLSIQCFRFESFDLFLFGMSHAHRPSCLPRPPPNKIRGVPYGKKVGA